ncbi:Auxin transporter-like protein [Vigna angularis]|uniref:Auxin transporter-like protein n=1 Tax=Phaseolus angularis TaxID=3914 RepID=A0A8T0KJ28_PHAAN|nr:Auxin transporter-like protein [Vigna angularis]
MASDKVVETVIAGNYVEMETEGQSKDVKSRLSNFLWHGGSVYDAWFSCASNQVAQVLLTLPYSFSQLGMLSGILFQLFYGILGSWTAYLISILYVEYRTRKEREKVNFRNHVIQWFEVLDGLLGKHWRNVGPSLIDPAFLRERYFLAFREIMHAMWKPQKFKAIYLLATLYVLTLTLPSAAAVYWAFGDMLLNHSNAFALLPKSPFRDMAFITFGFACTPLYFVWEKAIGMHECKSLCKRALVRLPVVIPIWFLAIIFPFFGPINSTVGSLLVSFTVYIIPALAHIFTFKSSSARQNAVEQPPKFVGRWVGTFIINSFVVVWVLVVGFGFGGWASMVNFIHQIDTFGLFTKCYQCPPPLLPPMPPQQLNATAPSPLHHPHLGH